MSEEYTAPVKKSLLRRVGSALLFVILPLIVLGVAWLMGRGVFDTVTTRLQLQNEYNGRVETFEAEATAIAPVEETGRRTDGLVLAGFSRPVQQDDPTPTPLALEFATNTPRPELQVTIPALNTVAPMATATPVPVEPLVLPTLLFPSDPDEAMIARQPTAVPTRITPITRNYDLVNIVLLGSDEEITDDNTIRTDTMMVVSINRDTGTVSMLSLPRDMFVYIPGLGMNRLNVAYGWGENAGWTDGGFGLLRQTIIYNFGINVHFYAKVNISQFEDIVDLLGGVDIAVDCAIQDFYPVAPIEELDLTKPIEENYYLRTLDVGYYTLDGFDAQWYARSRKNSSDFDRGRRQQQVVRAIFRKALGSGQLANLPSLWNEGMAIVDTNLTLNDALSLVPIGLNLDSREIESFTLIPTYHTTSWTAPDGANVQLPVYDTLVPLLEDFYTPPTDNQVAVRGSTIRVFNGTDNENLDIVAAERLQYSGFAAYAVGESEDGLSDVTQLIDYTGQTKGSSSYEIADILSVPAADILQEPDPNRAADFDVILGENYNSCTFGVLPVDEN